MHDELHTLLATLVGHHPPATVLAVLHHNVVLHRADGTTVEGRPAVVAMFEAPDNGVRYQVLEAREGVVRVAMLVPGIPGTLGFSLRGEVTEGLLARVYVDAAEIIRFAGDTP